MSFILDALKKSEKARQRQAGPSLFEVKITAPKRTLPTWAVVLGVLLAINAAAVGWIMSERPARRAAPAAVAGRAVSNAAPHAAATASALPAVNTAAANSAAQAHTAHTPSVAPPSQRSFAAPAADAAASDYAPAMEPPAQEQSDANLPLYRQLDSAPGNALPSLHLDLHVYDSQPSKRFVMINMHKLKDGSSLPDGVKVVSIRPDGVVLSYRGRHFLLPR